MHNKGIVVDGATVLVSSQNWSTDGTLYNRDAGVIIDHQDAAQYFQQIFLHDWEHLAAAGGLGLRRRRLASAAATQSRRTTGLRDRPAGDQPCLMRWIRVMRLIRCTIGPQINHITRINHVNLRASNKYT